MANHDYLGSAEAARLLGVDRATFNRWVKAGRLAPAHTMQGKTGARLFDRRDVEALAASRESVAS